MYRILQIECDVSKNSRVISPLNARTLDFNSNKAKVSFKQDLTTPYAGYDGMTAVFRFFLPNGSVLEQSGLIVGDMAEVQIRNDVFYLEGEVELEIKVTDTNFDITASQNTKFNVKKVLEGEDVPPNTTFGMTNLQDVEVTNLQNGDALVFNGVKWENRPFAGAVGSVVVTSTDEPVQVVDYWFDKD